MGFDDGGSDQILTQQLHRFVTVGRQESFRVPTHHTFIGFSLVCIGIMVLPNPSNFFLLAHGIGHGRPAALMAMVGIEAASAIRVLLTAAGRSAVVASSAVGLGVLRWAGVVYLAYLGFRSVRSAVIDHLTSGGAAPMTSSRSAVKGLMVGLGNPKMVMFFVAFFPQVDERFRTATDRRYELG